MYLLIEDYAYPDSIADLLPDLPPQRLSDGRIKWNYVGYYYHPASAKQIYLLPKVILHEGKLVLGKYPPEALIMPTLEDNPLSSEDWHLLSSLALWLYQGLALFNKRHPESELPEDAEIAGLHHSPGLGKATLLDYVLALQRFQREHQQLLLTTQVESRHHNHQPHWGRTISHLAPFLEHGIPHYLETLGHTHRPNSSEDLLTLYYSTLRYLSATYGLAVHLPEGQELYPPKRIANWIATGRATRLLRKCRGRYFRDELCHLWRLLYAYYIHAEQVAQRKSYRELLLVSNYNVVFEDMIDALIGDRHLPQQLKEQQDGKILDHLYRNPSPIEGETIYFIGDSKYYREDRKLGSTARYKQFTYAKNVIQYHIDILEGIRQGEQLRYRDPLTEGYSPSPNFFIRGCINPEELRYSQANLKQVGQLERSWHFRNRLFDRDTLLLMTFDINFLYVLASYVQSRGANERVAHFLRKQFRSNIIDSLDKHYSFYELQLSPSLTIEDFLDRSFRQLIGKLYYTIGGKLLLALDKDSELSPQDLLTPFNGQVTALPYTLTPID